jgi:hypothetical protein
MSQVPGKRGPQMPDPSTLIERGPCVRCGTRGDLGCKHGTTRILTVFA